MAHMTYAGNVEIGAIMGRPGALRNGTMPAYLVASVALRGRGCRLRTLPAREDLDRRIAAVAVSGWRTRDSYCLLP